jgi:hypothetical protein
MKQLWEHKWYVLGAVALVLFLTTRSYAGSTPINVQVAYADTVHPSPHFFTPLPFFGNSDGGFIGNGGPYDTGALKLSNSTSHDVNISDVWVDVGGVELHPWDSVVPFAVAAKSFVVMVQTNDPCIDSNFNTSDANPGACDAPNSIVPVIHVVADGIEYLYFDSAQILNTGGSDFFDCTGLNEGQKWEPTTK